MVFFWKSKSKPKDICTGVCDKLSICPYDKDKKFRWGVKMCSKQINVKRMCDNRYPALMRPILPYEKTTTLNINEVSILAVKGFDMDFIKQTKDRRRLIGTAKKMLLVHRQYVKGINIQKLTPAKRKILAENLLRDFFVGH